MGNTIGQHNSKSIKFEFSKPETYASTASIAESSPLPPVVSNRLTRPEMNGPKFEFKDKKVLLAEEKLRSESLLLKEKINTHSVSSKKEIPFNDILHKIEECLPSLYMAYDEYIAALLATGESPVQCQKGCSHCCSHYVTSVEPFELLFVHAHIRELPEYSGLIFSLHQRASIYHQILQNEKPTEEAEDIALYRYFLKNQSCPFLQGDGRCGVYAARPFSCRMFYSYSNPKFCSGKSIASPRNKNFIIELPEDIEENIASAGESLRKLSLSENFFSGLLQVNELFGRFDKGNI